MKATTNLIKNVRNWIMLNDMDWFHVIIGDEGLGKTSLACSMAKEYKPDYKLNTMTYTPKGFKEAVENSNKGDVVIADEGAMTFFSQETATRSGRMLVKLLTVMRARNLFIIICVPNFWLLTRYIREQRVKSVSRIVKRGWAWHYGTQKSRNHIRRHKYDKLKTIWPDYDVADTFPDAAKEWPDEWIEYLEKKMSTSVEAKNEAVNTKCERCGWEWFYKGNATSVTCAGCHKQTTAHNIKT